MILIHYLCIMMKRYKKQLLISLLLFVYVSGMAIYFVPRNTEMTVTEKIVTIAVSYLLVVAVGVVLLFREKLRNKY